MQEIEIWLQVQMIKKKKKKRLVWWQISSPKYLLHKWDYFKWPHFTSGTICVISAWGWIKFSHSVWSNLLLFVLLFTSSQIPWRILFCAAGGSDAPWRQPSNHGSSSPNGGFFLLFFSFHFIFTSSSVKASLRSGRMSSSTPALYFSSLHFLN